MTTQQQPTKTLASIHIIPIQALMRDLPSAKRAEASEYIKTNIATLPVAEQDAAYARFRTELEHAKMNLTTQLNNGLEGSSSPESARFAAPDSNGSFPVHHSPASSSSERKRKHIPVEIDGDTEMKDSNDDDQETFAAGESDVDSADELELQATRKLIQAQEQKLKETTQRLALKKARKLEQDVEASAKKRKAWLDGIGVMKLALQQNEFDPDEVGYGCPENPKTYVPVLKPTVEGVARLRELMRLPKTAIERAVGMVTTGIELLETHAPLYFNARFHYKRTKEQLARIKKQKLGNAEARRAEFDEREEERRDQEIIRRNNAELAATLLAEKRGDRC